MSDSTRNDANPDADEETIRTVEDVLSAYREGTHIPADPSTPAGFYAALAGSAPAAHERFRRDLRSRLIEAYADTEPSLRSDEPAPSAHEDESLRWAPPPLPTRQHREPAQPAPRPKRPWPVPRRAVSLVAGLAGVALLAVLLANMAVVLERRNATPTPVPAVNADLSLAVDKFGPDHPIEAAGVRYFAWSPDGQRVATAFGNNVEIWDAASGRLLNRIEVTGTTALAWSPDGRSVAAGGGSNTIRLLNASTGTQTASMTGPVPSPVYPEYDPYEVSVLAWSPDGRKLASIAGEDRTVRVWDVASATQAYSMTVPGGRFEPANAPILEVTWSPDGAYIATRAERRNMGDYDIAFWESASGRFLFSIPARTVGTPAPFSDTSPRGARSVSWQPGTTRAAVAIGRVTQIWDVASGTQVIAMPDPPPPPLPVPTAVPTTMPPNWTPLPTYPPPPLPTDALGQPIYPPSPPPYESSTPGPTYALSAERYTEVVGALWSPDGSTLATIDGVHIRLWDAATGTQKQRFRAGAAVLKIAWMADGDVLAALEGEAMPAPPGQVPQISVPGAGTIRLWDARTGAELRTILDRQVSEFYPSPTGDALAIRSGSSVVLWTDTAPPPPTPSPTPTFNLTPIIIAEPEAPPPTPEPPCGAWAVVPGPDLGGAEADLRAVSAAPGSTNDVWATGYLRESGQPRTLIARWDGATWQRVPSPNTGTAGNFLNSVAAIAPDDVWAVGYYSATMDVQQALALHWDGTTWAELPLGDAAPEGSSLNAVSGSGPNDVWAVGTAGGKFTLALHWDGARWTRASAPSPGVEANSLLAVVAVYPAEVLAGGRYVNRYEPRGGDAGRPYILRWDGSRWKAMPAPGDSSLGTQAVGPSGISGLAATGPGDIWSVGSIIDIRSAGQVDRWHDPLWLTSLYPYSYENTGGGYSTRLNALAALNSNDVWVVGSVAGFENPGPSGSQLEQPLAYHWNGKQWARAQSPTIPGTEARLRSAAAVSTYDVWAVGSTNPAGLNPDGSLPPFRPSPLIMRYTGPGCGTPSP